MPRLTRFVTLCLLASAVFFATARPSLPHDPAGSDSVSTILEARIAVGADSCPTAVEVWLISTPDTIQAMELVLSWDRPDFARFTTEQVKLPALDTLVSNENRKTADSAVAPARVITKPVMNRRGGLIEEWEYAEARGENGLAAKVAAFACLTGEPKANPISPARTGLLFTLPVEILTEPPFATADDSSVVRFDSALTRLSDTKGNLLNNIVLRSPSIRTAPCWRLRSKH